MTHTNLQALLDRLHQDPSLELQTKAALVASLTALGLSGVEADALATSYFSWLLEDGGSQVASLGLSTPLAPPATPIRKPAKKPAKKPAPKKRR